MQLAQELRRQAIFAYIDFQGRSLKAQMRLANRLNSRFTCIIGEEERKSGEFPLKRMENGHQVTLERKAIASYVRGNDGSTS